MGGTLNGREKNSNTHFSIDRYPWHIGERRTQGRCFVAISSEKIVAQGTRDALADFYL